MCLTLHALISTENCIDNINHSARLPAGLPWTLCRAAVACTQAVPQTRPEGRFGMEMPAHRQSSQVSITLGGATAIYKAAAGSSQTSITGNL